MTKICMRNASHHRLSETRCLVCNSQLVDREEQEADEKSWMNRVLENDLERGEQKVVRDDRVVAATETEIEAAQLKAQQASAAVAADPVRPEAAAKAKVDKAPTLPAVEETPKTLIERVEAGVAEDLTAFREKIASLVERAFGHESEAQQAAAAAADHARTAAGTAAKAAADARPNAAAPGFGEAARHAEGADFHATAAKTAADEAASHAAAATQARQAAETIAAGAEQSLPQPPTSTGLQRVVDDIEAAVARVADFAARAKAALARAESAAGETTALGRFFAEAVKLWRAIKPA